MGRELVRQLAAEGCHVATSDVSQETLEETRALAEDDAPPATRITTFVADVADEAQWQQFREHVAGEHSTNHINLLFNNAGIGGGGSFVMATESLGEGAERADRRSKDRGGQRENRSG